MMVYHIQVYRRGGERRSAKGVRALEGRSSLGRKRFDRREVFSLAGGGGTGLLVGGCAATSGGGGDGSKAATIGVSFETLETEFWVAANDSIKSGAKDR